MSEHEDPLRVLIVEDDSSLRKRLVRLVEELGFASVSHENAEGIPQGQALSDLALAIVDMRLPRANGVEAVKLLRQHNEGLPIIFISGESEPAEIIEGMKLGVIDFLLKPFSLDDLLAAIERAAALTRQRQARRLASEQARQRLERLTQRERDVLALLVQGHKTGEAARILGMAPGTAKIHRMHALEKLQALSVAEVMTWLRQCGLEGVCLSA